MPRISGYPSDHASTSDCTGCRKQSGTLQCIECIRDGSGSAVFCANGCFKAHWQQHRKSLLGQAARYVIDTTPLAVLIAVLTTQRLQLTVLHAALLQLSRPITE